MANSARIFTQRLRNTPAKTQTVDDEFDRAVIVRLQERGIANGVLNDEDDEPHHKKVLRILREDREWQEHYQAEKAQREAEQAKAQLTTAQHLAKAIGGQSPSGHMPLNGAQVLHAALVGGAGTINGRPSA